MSNREAIQKFHKNCPGIRAEEVARKFKTSVSYVHNWWNGPNLHTSERGGSFQLRRVSGHGFQSYQDTIPELW